MRRTRCALIWTALLLVAIEACHGAPAPPGQPKRGPGSSDYRHTEVKSSLHGKGDAQYWLFEPAGPVPKTAPVVVFLHGWGAINPDPYGAWIEHIVKRGNIVVYPAYQSGFGTPVNRFTPNAIAAIVNAYAWLRSESSAIKPDPQRLALVGHSAGGVICANIAALAQASGLPEVKAFMSVEPGRTRMVARRFAIPLEDMSLVPPGTLLLTVAGDRDRIARDTDARRILFETARVPAQNKNMVLVVSDSHGVPPLEAHHFSPLARNGPPAPVVSSGRQLSAGRERMLERQGASGDRPPDPTRAELPDEDELPDVGVATVGAPDALDYFGYWKLLDGLTDAAFYGWNRAYALGNTPEQRYMGAWSDGRLVNEAVIFTLQ